MQRTEKDQVINDLRTDLERAAGVLFVDFTGLTVAEADGLRRQVWASGNSRYVVVKNTLMRRALADKPFANAGDALPGTPTAVLYGFEDPVSNAKLLFDYMKGCPHLRVKGGVVDGKAISPQEAEALSKMPSKGEMQASIVALALSPGRKIAGQLASPAGKLVGAIEALADRLAGGEAA